MKNLKMKRNFRSMLFLLLPVAAGFAIALQTALSGKLTLRFGAIETVIAIHLFGLIASLLVYFIQGNTSFAFFKQIDLIVLIAGALGVVIVFSISKSFIENGALTTVMISVLVQLVISKLIDQFGLFGVEKSPFTLTEGLGMLLMISGVIVFQIKN